MRCAIGLLALGLAGCAYVSPEVAARECRGEGRVAPLPAGYVTVGVGGSRGVRTGVGLGFPIDLRGRGPGESYEDCIERRSGVAVDSAE